MVRPPNPQFRGRAAIEIPSGEELANFSRRAHDASGGR